jgi:hypothetical protein
MRLLLRPRLLNPEPTKLLSPNREFPPAKPLKTKALDRDALRVEDARAPETADPEPTRFEAMLALDAPPLLKERNPDSPELLLRTESPAELPKPRALAAAPFPRTPTEEPPNECHCPSAFA